MPVVIGTTSVTAHAVSGDFAPCVPARLGRDARYGLGVIIRPSPLGESWGHSGFFPGYATEMAYFPATRTAVALQINATNPYPRGMFGFVVNVANALPK